MMIVVTTMAQTMIVGIKTTEIMITGINNDRHITFTMQWMMILFCMIVIISSFVPIQMTERECKHFLQYN